MPFYIRKSLSFGPLRFNLSNAGIGVSAGVKGFRVGTGPRGNYIQAGRGGIYYRATLPGGTSRSRQLDHSPIPQQTTVEPLVDIESADAAAMVDANSIVLLAELNQKHKLVRIWPMTLALGLLAMGLGIASAHAVPVALGAILALAAIPAAIWDSRRKTTVLFYDLEEPVLSAVERLHAAFDQLRACGRTSVIEAEGRNYNLKYNAGAGTNVRRRKIHLETKAPPYFKTNIAVFCIPSGHQRLFFFPDRILVYSASNIGAISYDELRFNTSQTRFVENEGVPSDARIVDKTWQYVNKGGGPDRRFSNNPELPVALYEELWLHSTSGLNQKIQFSRMGVSSGFVQAVQELASVLKAVPNIAAIVPDAGADSESGQLEDAELNTAPEVPESVPVTVQDTTPQPNGDRKFFYFESGVRGPYTLLELAEFRRVGNISSETQVCSEDDNRWLPYDTFLNERQ